MSRRNRSGRQRGKTAVGNAVATRPVDGPNKWDMPKRKAKRSSGVKPARRYPGPALAVGR